MINQSLGKDSVWSFNKTLLQNKQVGRICSLVLKAVWMNVHRVCTLGPFVTNRFWYFRTIERESFIPKTSCQRWLFKDCVLINFENSWQCWPSLRCWWWWYGQQPSLSRTGWHCPGVTYSLSSSCLPALWRGDTFSPGYIYLRY